MKDVKSLVFEAHKEVLENSNLNATTDLDTVVGRESGLDSMGIVDFVISLEEKLDISLDSILAQIRQSNTLKDIVILVEDLIQKQH